MRSKGWGCGSARDANEADTDGLHLEVSIASKGDPLRSKGSVMGVRRVVKAGASGLLCESCLYGAVGFFWPVNVPAPHWGSSADALLALIAHA